MIAGATHFFSRRHWLRIDRPLFLIGAGMITGFLNGILAQLIAHAANLEVYQGTLPVYHFFLKLTSNAEFAAIAEKMFVEIADKTIAFMIAAGAVFLLRDLLADYKKRLQAKGTVSRGIG